MLSLGLGPTLIFQVIVIDCHPHWIRYNPVYIVIWPANFQTLASSLCVETSQLPPTCHFRQDRTIMMIDVALIQMCEVLTATNTGSNVTYVVA